LKRNKAPIGENIPDLILISALLEVSKGIQASAAFIRGNHKIRDCIQPEAALSIETHFFNHIRKVKIEC
jgi:hypothetical protein